MTRRKTASMVVALAVTLGLLWLAMRNVSVTQLWAVLSRARVAWVPLMVSISMIDLLIRAVRWSLLLERAGGRPAVWPLLKLEAIGMAINNVLFMRLGELARAVLAARHVPLPMATALSSVAVERALDVSALLALFIVASSGAAPLVPDGVRRLAALGLCGVLGALAALALAERRLLANGPWERRLRRWPKLHDLIAQLAAGAAVLRSAATAAQVAALSLALWAIDALFYWAAARSLGLGWALDYSDAILVLSWAGAGAALPAAPGAFGTFEAAVKNIVMGLGVSAHEALGYAFFAHMVGYLAVTIVGLVFLYRVGLSVTELRTALERKEGS